jgi:ArsR family transcriptional regulator, arsenate/arsenite/antimonite-responsive transcriptional repressor
MVEVDLFKLLSDENRFKIFVLLMNKEACICDLEAVLNLKQANVSKHMMKFRELNVVKVRKDAQWVYYRISEEFIRSNQLLVSYIEEIIRKDEELTQIINHTKNKIDC